MRRADGGRPLSRKGGANGADGQALPLRIISFYQRRISPLFPPRCRYYPSCSQYAYEAIARYGFLFGGLLGALRLLRCNPLFPGGVDPVPEFKKIAYKKPGASRREEENGSSRPKD